jgi:hypothetical protein
MWHVWGSDAHTVLMEKREGERPLLRPRRRWKDSVQTDLKKRMNWIDLSQDRVRWWATLDEVMKLRVP